MLYCAEGLEEVLCYTDPFMMSRREANSKRVLAHTFTERLSRRKTERMVYSLIVWGSLNTPGAHI